MVYSYNLINSKFLKFDHCRQAMIDIHIESLKGTMFLLLKFLCHDST